MTDLFEAAKSAMNNSYAPYSNFKVGAALRSGEGTIFTGCNVENVAYPEGCCAEAGAISSMVVGGHRRIQEVLVIAAGPQTIAPCGGCRQKIAEFADRDCVIILAGPEGERARTTIGDLLPGAFSAEHLEG